MKLLDESTYLTGFVLGVVSSFTLMCVCIICGVAAIKECANLVNDYRRRRRGEFFQLEPENENAGNILDECFPFTSPRPPI